MIQHQYVERETGEVRDEPLLGDKAVNFLYSVAREKTPILFRALTGSKISELLGFVNFDIPLGNGRRRLLRNMGVDLGECIEPPERLDTARKIFERQIDYERCRPMAEADDAIVSPADSKVIVGSLKTTSALFLKEKFFHFTELLGPDRAEWISAFEDGDYAVFRLTPEKYHYNHTPVAGTVLDCYEIGGAYHSCNPGAVVALVTPFSKNKRVLTVIDTDVPDGSRVGLVAMIEIVALMIGDIVQGYSESGYENPRPLSKGMFLKKGCPKSLYRPGSSTDVILFQKDRIAFAGDLIRNQNRQGIRSRFSAGFGRPLVETEIRVRSPIAFAAGSTIPGRSEE